MAITYEQAVEMKNRLRDEYEEDHSDFRRLRALWHGKFWENETNRPTGITGLFRDLRQRSNDVGPDIRLTYNLLRDICVKFQTFLAPLPMIRVYVDPPSSAKRMDAAARKERFLYGTWSENNMNGLMADQGWYLPLMGNVSLGIYPDMEKNICRAILRSPEHMYPVPSFDYGKMDAVIFCFDAHQSAVMRQYPNFRPQAKRGRGKGSDPKVEILEFSDENCFYRWVDGQEMQAVEHNFGFNLFDHIKFINVPGETFGEGAVKQSANLVEMGNAYLSLMMQSAIENVFPVMVLEDAMKAPEVIQRGAGAVIPVNAGGKVYYLQPPAGNLIAQSDWAQRIEQMIKTDTSMPDVSFGTANNSVITGKAINELQGAGSGSLVEMVQGVGIGSALCSWNEKAIHISRTMFAEDTIRLFGKLAGSIADLNPKQFSMNIKGSELTGSTRNEVVFMPYLDMHTKVVIGLQLAGGGLVSRAWQRNQVGIPDSEAMDEEIVAETIQDAALQLLVQTITTPEEAEEITAHADSIIEGQLRAGPPAPPPELPRAGAPGPPSEPQAGGGPAVGELPGGGQVLSPALQQPLGSPPPIGSPEAAQSTGQTAGQSISLDQAIQAFQQLQGAQGRIFLVGEIVQQGQARDSVDVLVTSADDKGLVSTVPFPVTVRVISGQPNEPYMEVTPGAPPQQGGSAPKPEDLLSG